MLDDGFAGARRPRSGDDHGDDGIGADSIGAARLGSTCTGWKACSTSAMAATACK